VLSRRSPSSLLKVQKRTLPWGWYFMGLDMKEGSEVKRASCVSGPTLGEKVARLQGEK
jgi:hypothetical protein